MIKLSIIIPYYNSFSSTVELMKKLQPQLTEEVEVIIIDDGCHEEGLDQFKAQVIHLNENSGGASVPRNAGLDKAQGQYIAFIDSDDLVSDHYVATILKMLPQDYDYFYISWKTDTHKVIIRKEPPAWNCCVWNCIYKRSLIGDIRFDPALKMAEDYDFNKKVRRGRRGNVLDILYFYNQHTPNSLTKQGQLYNAKYKET